MRKLTEGNITRLVLTFTLPFLLGATLQRFYTLIDMVMVGRFLGTNPLAAVGATGNIAIMFTCICAGFTGGFSIIIGQSFGEGNEKKLKKNIAHTYLLSSIILAVLMAAGFLLKEKILHWTRIPDELHPLASTYLTISIGGLFTAMVYNMCASVLKAIGDSILPLVFLAISVIMNIGLDYVFIAILQKGVAGAAIATVISQGFSGLLCVIYCMKKRPILKVSLQDFSLKENYFNQLIPQGISMSLMISVISTGTVILQTGINSLGAEVIAGYTAGRKFIEFFLMPGGALSETAAAFTSQNYGARKYDRIRKGTKVMILSAWIVDFIEMIAVLLFARYMVMAITGKDASPQVIHAGELYLKSNLPFYFFVSVFVICRCVLQGMSKKKTPVVASIMECAVKILSVAVLVPLLGYRGVVITEPSIWILGAIWVWVNYSRHLKKKLKELPAE